MVLAFVPVVLKSIYNFNCFYEDEFAVDPDVNEVIVPKFKLINSGIISIGKYYCELESGEIKEFDFGLVTIEIMGEITAGRVIFGPDTCTPTIGRIVLENIGINVQAFNKNKVYNSKCNCFKNFN